MSQTGTNCTKLPVEFTGYWEIVGRPSLPLLYEYLCVLHRDLQDESQTAVVEGLIQGHQRPVDSAFQQVAAVLPQTNGYDPVDHLLIGPHQHVWGQKRWGPASECKQVSNKTQQTSLPANTGNSISSKTSNTRRKKGSGAKEIMCTSTKCQLTGTLPLFI